MIKTIQGKSETFLLFLLLETLYGVLWSDPGTAASQAFLLIHLGIFLIWQPILLGSQKYTWYNALSFIALALLFTFAINGWLAIGWVILLIGMVAGRVITNKSERITNFLVMVFLFLVLFVNCIPNLLLVRRVDFQVYSFLSFIIPFLPLILFVIPGSSIKKVPEKVDLLQAITASLFAGLISLGSLVIMNRTQFDFFFALFQTLLIMGIGLMLISWLLTSSGSGGLAELWSRTLLNIGTPFEQWLNDLTYLKDQHDSAEEFLDAAIIKLVTLPWITGVIWRQQDNLNIHGIKSRHEINLAIHNDILTIYTDVAIKGALLLHCNLLVRLIEYLYESKLNEQILAKQTHIQAIYETGARITHDIKNLLQSMKSMLTILYADKSDDKTHSVEILKKQFPYFIQRLELAVAKLQTPENLTDENISLREWVKELENHYRHFDIEFELSLGSDQIVPYDLFATVAENLLENAIAKKKEQPDIRIIMNINSENDKISLTVTDTGHKIGKTVARQLLREPVQSDNGLGVGLMQTAQLAASMGYELVLTSNTDGNVTFKLASNSG